MWASPWYHQAVSPSSMWKILSVVFSTRPWFRSLDKSFKNISIIFIIFDNSTMVSIRFSVVYFRTPHFVLLIMIWASNKIYNDTFSGKRRLLLSAHNNVKNVCRIYIYWTDYNDKASHKEGNKEFAMSEVYQTKSWWKKILKSSKKKMIYN